MTDATGNDNWREQLELWAVSANRANLDRTLKSLTNGTQSEMSDDSQRIILAEIEKREAAANATRGEFFPRIAIRNIEDGEMLAEIVRSHAENAYARLSTLNMARGLREMGMPIAFFTPDGVQTDMTVALAAMQLECERASELLEAIMTEVRRIQIETDGKVTAENAEFNAAFDGIINRLKSEGTES